MRPILAIVFSTALAVALPAFAQHDHGAHQGAAPQKAKLTNGIVRKIDKSAGEIVIQHEQLDSIGMPPMTMAFGVADKRWLEKLKAGDRIRFAAEMKGGNAIVSRYELAR